jgi:hypothetical protein
LSRFALSTFLAASLALGPAVPPSPAAALTRADYESCQAADEESFRQAVEAISLRALESGIKSIDYAAVVAEEWRRQGLDEIVDKQVDRAIEEVRAETSWSGLAQSLVSKEKAQALATQVAERVYRSGAVKSAIEGLAAGVGKEVGRTIELASQDAAEPSLECLRSFIGRRYGATVAGVVTGEAERDFGVTLKSGGADISSGAVIRQSSEGITGAAILIVRRQLANMAARIGQRLAGAVLSRLVSVVAGGVGLVLIAKDLWELRNGVLPIVAEEMKSQATKNRVKGELASSVSEQIGEHVREIAAKSAERIVEIWQGFRRAHAKALDLAARHEGFRRFLDAVRPEALARLDEITGLVMAAEGEAGILKRLDDGSLNEAVRFMPEPAMAIARERRSIDAALKWAALAGDWLETVVDHGLYRCAEAGDFTRSSLASVLALEDRVAISHLCGVGREARETLLGLDRTELKTLARSLTEEELTSLASYVRGLEPGPRERVLKAVAASPAKMQMLAGRRVREAVLASADQSAAVDMMLRESGADPAAAVADFTAAWEGRVSPILLWDKHPFLIGLAGALFVLILLMLRRLLLVRQVPQT